MALRAGRLTESSVLPQLTPSLRSPPPASLGGPGGSLSLSAGSPVKKLLQLRHPREPSLSSPSQSQSRGRALTPGAGAAGLGHGLSQSLSHASAGTGGGGVGGWGRSHSLASRGRATGAGAGAGAAQGPASWPGASKPRGPGGASTSLSLSPPRPPRRLGPSLGPGSAPRGGGGGGLGGSLSTLTRRAGGSGGGGSLVLGYQGYVAPKPLRLRRKEGGQAAGAGAARPPALRLEDPAWLYAQVRPPYTTRTTMTAA